ncbi:MAG: tRNA pseudouridine(55) synthase TruB [Armatimonadia bacterium]
MNGFLNLLKPPGMTSHDVVQVARRTLRTKAIGHTGTLDPAAAGVLVLTVGYATRLGEYVADAVKGYRAEIALGVTTDSGDVEGAVTARASAADVTEERVRAALGDLTGTVTMRPPVHSAVRVNGERLYKLARAGEAVEAPERVVEVYALELLEFVPCTDTALVRVDVTCSKGTYIRSLATMLGEKLGCGAHLSMLIRTRVGAMRIDEAVTLEELAADPARPLLTAQQAIPDLPRVMVSEPQREALVHGQAVQAVELAQGPVLVYDEAGELVCLGESSGELIQPHKVFQKSQH